MSDVSPELNQISTNKGEIRSGKTPDKTVKGSLKKVVRKVILGTPLAGLLISSTSIDNPNIPLPKVKDQTPAVSELSTEIPSATIQFAETPMTPVPTPSEQQTPTMADALHQGVSEKDYMHQKLSVAAKRTTEELKLAGIDIDKKFTQDYINNIVNESIPYLTKELQIEAINAPPFTENDYPGVDKGASYYFDIFPSFIPFRHDVMRIGGSGTIYSGKRDVIHELVHAQEKNKPKDGKWIVSPRKETFAEIVTWEILANQALDGDLLAKYLLTNEVLCTLNGSRGKNEYPVCFNNRSPTVAILMDVLNGKRESYGNVQLDGLVQFFNKNVLATNTD